MQSMQDLDRKRRHSAMRTKSNVFNDQAAPEQFLGSSKQKTSRPQNTMDVLLAYDLGPVTKVGFNRKRDVQDKVSNQSSKDIRSNTFIRMGRAKNERVQTA